MLHRIPCGALDYPSLPQQNLSPIDSIPHSCYTHYMTKNIYSIISLEDRVFSENNKNEFINAVMLETQRLSSDIIEEALKEYELRNPQ